MKPGERPLDPLSRDVTEPPTEMSTVSDASLGALSAPQSATGKLLAFRGFTLQATWAAGDLALLPDCRFDSEAHNLGQRVQDPGVALGSVLSRLFMFS